MKIPAFYCVTGFVLGFLVYFELLLLVQAIPLWLISAGIFYVVRFSREVERQLIKSRPLGEK